MTKQEIMESRRNQTSQWFEQLRDQLCKTFEAIEDEYAQTQSKARFKQKEWARESDDHSDGGGGVMSIMHGQVFEKIGINISKVEGRFSEDFKGRIPGTEKDPSFWASGISLVAHPQNPYVPAVHMNTRYLNTGGIAGKQWLGGGADLTPIISNEEDIADFHQALKSCCDSHDPAYYDKYKAWCDEYFHLKHRNEPRGAGGIFYDYLDKGDFEAEFAFTQDVGRTFGTIYPILVRRRMNEPYTAEDRHFQLVRRGRYVEFNLLYDRGTIFGLNTGGNTEAILMSLPPEVRWP